MLRFAGFCGIFFTLFIISNTYATELSGIIKDASNDIPLKGASVSLLINDKVKYLEHSDNKGHFNIADVKSGDYILKINFIGFSKYEKKLKVGTQKQFNLGTISLQSEDIISDEVLVTAAMPLGEQKQDTSVFNAQAFKTNPDASAEDLVKKMPGIQVENDGTVKSQGESVKKVLVDGKPFFGDDPTAALRNLPADVIDKVEVFDRVSDNAEFTGFDDGNTEKAMNIITKQNKRTGDFGKVTGGYGTDNKYNASLVYNNFGGYRRLSVLGMANNVNQRNFSIEDIVGAFGGSGGPGGGRRPFMGQPSRRMMSNSELRPQGGNFSNVSSFLVNPDDGIAKSNAFGINFSDFWAEKIDFSGSYFFNYTNNFNDQYTLRDYFLANDSLQNYSQQGVANSYNYNHRLNLKIKYDIDDNNAVLFKPSLSYQKYNADGTSNSSTKLNSLIPLNFSDNVYETEYYGTNFSGSLAYKLRLNEQGRTITATVNGAYNDKDGDNLMQSQSLYYNTDAVISDTLDQKASSLTTNKSYGGELTYTEPLSETSKIQAIYSFNQNNNYAETFTNNLNLLTNNYEYLDSLLSNKTDNDYLTQKAGISYRYKTMGITVLAGLNYQKADLNSDMTFPSTIETKKSFENILPSLQLKINLGMRDNIRLFYRTSTLAPTVNQLQEFVDNSNPLQLTSGNIDLKQQYSHTLMTRFHSMSSDMSSMFMTMFAINIRSNYITTSNFIAQNDTIIDNRIDLKTGSQYAKPINMDGYWDGRFFINYGFPVRFISSNLNVGAGGMFTRTPTLINDIENISNSYTLNTMLNLSSNISENLDYNINTQYNLNYAKNSSYKNSKNSSIAFNVDLNWIFWEGFFLNANFRSQFYQGDNIDSESSDYKILNLAIGKKFFNNSLEIKLTSYDILNNNKSYTTNFTEYYNESVRNSILKQYTLLSVSYSLRAFSK